MYYNTITINKNDDFNTFVFNSGFSLDVLVYLSPYSSSTTEPVMHDLKIDGDISIERSEICTLISKEINTSNSVGALIGSDQFSVMIRITDNDNPFPNTTKKTLYTNINRNTEWFITAQNPILAINKGGYVKLLFDNYANSNSNTKCLTITSKSGINYYPYAKNLELTSNTTSKEYDLDKIFATADCGASFIGNSYPSGILSKYKDRMPMESLYGNPFYLTVRTNGLMFDDEGNAYMFANQIMAIKHTVTNSSGYIREAVSEFERINKYENGEITTGTWVHLNTYDTDGKSYTWTKTSFTPK